MLINNGMLINPDLALYMYIFIFYVYLVYRVHDVCDVLFLLCYYESMYSYVFLCILIYYYVLCFSTMSFVYYHYCVLCILIKYYFTLFRITSYVLCFFWCFSLCFFACFFCFISGLLVPFRVLFLGGICLCCCSCFFWWVAKVFVKCFFFHITTVFLEMEPRFFPLFLVLFLVRFWCPLIRRMGGTKKIYVMYIVCIMYICILSKEV